MNEYLKAFQEITQSTEQLLANEYHSLESTEIKQSAASLERAVEPCIQELKLSAAKLKERFQACMDNIEHSQDVWDSKSRIASAPTSEIWQHLGDVSGCHFRIQRITDHYKQIAVKEAKDTWENAIESLTNKYFFDHKRQLKKGIGYDDKNGFLRDINIELNSQSAKLYQTIKKYLELIFLDININQIKLGNSYFNLLDNKEKNNWEEGSSKTIEEVISGFNSSIKIHDLCCTLDFKIICQLVLDGWKKNWGDIYWEQLVNFREDIANKIEQRINLMFENRLELAKEYLEKIIFFYDSFLIRQEQYQQETLVQRQAEKAWLEQQHQKLLGVQIGIEAILN